MILEFSLILLGLIILAFFTYWIATKGIYKIEYPVQIVNLTNSSAVVTLPDSSVTIDSNATTSAKLALGDTISATVSSTVYNYTYYSKNVVYIYIFEDGIYDNLTSFQLSIVNSTSQVYYVYVELPDGNIGTVNPQAKINITTHISQMLLFSTATTSSTSSSASLAYLVHPSRQVVITDEGLVIQ